MEENPWIFQVENEVQEMGDTSDELELWMKHSIYKLPDRVTKLNPKAFTPQMVSFGPYHHGKKSLKEMEEHKHRALLHFLKRFKKPLKCYFKALTPIVQDLKDAYDQLDDKWEDTNKFLELMIVDGCFILEILWSATSTPPPTQTYAQAKTRAHTQPSTQIQAQDPTPTPTPTQSTWKDHQSLANYYAPNDPIFSEHGRLYFLPYVKLDMLMLENQIPMSVLQKLYDVASKPIESNQFCQDIAGTIDSECSLKEPVARLVLKFFSPSVKNIRQFQKCLHLLDVYRKSLLLENPRQRKSKCKWFPSTSTHRGTGDEIIRSATELIEAGITIKKSKSKSLRDISFHNGILELPVVVVDDALESSYLNMIAFERFHVGAGNEVSSYIFFMDCLIKSLTDVTLLEWHGIVLNYLSGNEAVVNSIKFLSMELALDPENSLIEVYREVNAYCEKPWSRWRANLMHNYFSNPKDSLNIQMAVFLFIFTIIQTIFTVLSYTSSSPRTH